MNCRCGAEVTRSEIRVISRCSHGHFVASSVAPAVVAPRVVTEPVNAPQLRALHAKANRLDTLKELPTGTSKRAALALIDVESASELSSDDASRVLDWLQAAIEEAEGS
jgi:hypothetical protein